jgi:hypothetical protein
MKTWFQQKRSCHAPCLAMLTTQLDDVVRNALHRLFVVADEEQARPFILADLHEKLDNRPSKHWIEPSLGFIGNDQTRLRCNGNRQRSPLSHASGELSWEGSCGT